jgi:hypothetical protein
MLAYGVSGDLIDEYLGMSEITFLGAMYKFCRAVIVVYDEVYLRREPTTVDTAWLLSVNEARWFPGMVDNIGYIHWEWNN